MPDENPGEHTDDTALALPNEPTTPGVADPAPESDAVPPPSIGPLSAERVIDIVFGAVAIAAEATGKKVQELGEQARTLQDNAPAILDSFEERGRPLREQLLGKIREGFAPIPDEPGTPGSDESSGESPAGRSADQDISALEQRVRELEAEVAPGEKAPDTSVSIPGAADPMPDFDTLQTPAEETTFVPQQDYEAGLADSPYAISETEEEAERERSEATEPNGEHE